MRKSIFTLFAITVVALSIAVTFVSAPVSAQDEMDNGLVTVTSASNVQETVDMLVSNLEANGLTVMGVVDHGSNAANNDLELRPTQLIIFGNPNLGTRLMQNSQTTAIDLPNKYLVWEDADGFTHVTYNGVPYLVDRHGLTGPREVLQTATGALANFAASVAVAEPGTMPATGATSTLMTLWVVLGLLGAGAVVILLPVLRGRTTMRIGALLLIAVVGGLLLMQISSVRAQEEDNKGLIIGVSPHSVDETVARLQREMTDRGLNIMLTIDHAANATTVDRNLRPTQLILFGNPKAGTPLMQSNRTIGIDLPQKMLVWEESDGRVIVAYNDPAYLGKRHAITDKDELLGNVAGALAAIVAGATAE